jgi:hypothetical protein
MDVLEGHRLMEWMCGRLFHSLCVMNNIVKGGTSGLRCRVCRDSTGLKET